MRSPQRLHDLLRHALLASLSVPIAVLGDGCGGSVEGLPAPEHDSGSDASEPAGDAAAFDATDLDQLSMPDRISSFDAASDAGDPCHPNKLLCPYFLPLSCSGAPAPDSSMPSQQECLALCQAPNQFAPCTVHEADGGELVAECYANCGVGRRPPKMRRGRASGTTTLARYFSQAAYLEAASVRAFRVLSADLAGHGAPRRLLRAAERAARDEVRHALMTDKLARRFGGALAWPSEPAHVPRSLEAIAIENAVEGCVRETFGALAAMLQGSTASDPRVRRTMARIAPDEMNHAALAWSVAAWAEPRLTPASRRRVERARRAAVRQLRDELRADPPADLVLRAGLPDAARASAMLHELDRGLWRAGRAARPHAAG